MLYGRQGIGKSSLAMQLAWSLVNQEPWLGFHVAQSGPVIYLQLDMSLEETRRVIARASVHAGMNFRGKLWTPAEENAEFNILDPAQETDLQDVIRQIQPIALIVDTAEDAFRPSSHNFTDEVRQVIRKFRRCCADGCFIYLKHERKMPSFGRSDDDPDSFSGPKEWEAVATASLQMQKKNGEYALRVRKSRLDTAGFDILPLQADGNGFFSAKRNSLQMLQSWPWCIADKTERDGVVASVSSAADVFRDLSERTGVDSDTIKKQYQRSIGVQFEFEHFIRDKH